MDHYVQQAFDINLLKIGRLTDAGVVQIGVGVGSKRKATPIAGYTMVGQSAVPLSVPAVPLQAPVREP